MAAPLLAQPLFYIFTLLSFYLSKVLQELYLYYLEREAALYGLVVVARVKLLHSPEGILGGALAERADSYLVRLGRVLQRNVDVAERLGRPSLPEERVAGIDSNGIGGGDHNQDDAYQFHVPFIISTRKQYNFAKYDDSMAKYDVFEEIEVELIKKLCPEIKDYDFTVDTKFNRNTFTTEYLLTTLNSGEPILSFDSSMKPSELGAILKISGKGLNLQRRDDGQYSKSRINTLKYIDIIKNTYRPTIVLSLKLLLTSIRAFLVRKKRQLFKL